MYILRHSSWMAGLLIAGLAASAALAQDQQSQDQQSQGGQNQSQSQPAAPIPAYHSPLASQADNGEPEENEAPTPDTRAPSGVQTLQASGPETMHSYWQPHLDIFGTADSNAQESPSGYSWGTSVSVSGGVDVHKVGGTSDLMVSYVGGGTFSDGENVGDGIIQQLGISDRFTLRRWTLSFFDQTSYLPESGYGYGGLGGGVLSTGTAGLGSTFTNNQSLLVGNGQNLSNSFDAEADVNLTPRTSLTFVGGYSLLHYFDSGLLNSGDVTARAGYNYLWSRKDTISVFYTFSAFNYSNYNQSINTHTIQLSYARRVTGRLAFQVAAGPEISMFREPIPSGTGASSSPVTANSTELYWALNSSVQYQLRRASLSAAYNHSVASGSGLLAGAVTDSVSGSATRQMSRTFSSGVTGGYAHNHGLIVGAGTPTSQDYDYAFVGANFSYPWGRTLGLTFSYQLQYQTSNASFCIGTIGSGSCGTSVIRHLISVGVGWHERPILFQ
jgi:hypothetical protein